MDLTFSSKVAVDIGASFVIRTFASVAPLAGGALAVFPSLDFIFFIVFGSPSFFLFCAVSTVGMMSEEVCQAAAND